MNRRKSRELTMKLLFETSINKRDVKEAIEDYMQENKDYKNIDFEYVNRIIKGIDENKDFVDKKIEDSLENWKLNRISKINMAILRIAVYEMFFEDDIPDKVSINEAIELTKVYSDQKSASFINGALGKILSSK
ncbi:MAG: transcription antitermination factor NusB [Clostridium sp.]|nr:transcription antitermination factor NusB [Clostridium sp.]